MKTGLLLAVLMIFELLPALAQSDPNCPEAPIPRLIIGEQAIVTPGSSNNVRDAASRDANRVGTIDGGEVVTVLDGPVCADGFNWWQVEFAEATGWTVEGTLDEYWVEPYEEETEATPVPEASATDVPPDEPIRSFEPPIEVVNTLVIGGRVRVINDDPDAGRLTLTVRAEPSRSGARVVQALEDDLLTIIGGPEEAEGLRWWQIETARGSKGWVAEGLVNAQRNDFYERLLMPVCPAEGERVVFRLGDFVITTAPDGSEPCVLDYIYSPAWLTFSDTQFVFDNVFLTAPDGEFFLYADGPLYRLSRDGSERQILTETVIRWASLSPDGQHIAVAHGNHIATLNSDGSRYARLTQGNSIRLWVEWLSDSETLVYTEQSDYRDQAGLAIQYTFYRINTQQGGLRPIVELPLGFDLRGAKLSPVTDRLAITGTEYELIDGMRGTESVKYLWIERAIDAFTRIVDADSGELVLDAPSSMYDLRWTLDGETLVDYSTVYDDEPMILPMETGEITTLTMSGDVLPDTTSFLAWQSNTAYLVHNGYGFGVDVSDFGIWSIDVMSGTVSRLR